jgi:hypothetical protein
MQEHRTYSRTFMSLASVLLAASACGDDAPASDKSDAVVTRAASAMNDAVSCAADAGVQVPVLTPRPVIQLWPPNHKFHSIRVADCVVLTGGCGLKAEFVWASSDEPIDSIGDGHFAPDIQVSNCGELMLRAERQGPKDGRVYKLGVRAVDAQGHVAESVCSVIVDHDQRGVVGADSGEAYRVLFDGKNGLPFCDGENPPPSDPPPPSNPPPGNPPTTEPPPSNPPSNPPANPPVDGPTPV